MERSVTLLATVLKVVEAVTEVVIRVVAMVVATEPAAHSKPAILVAVMDTCRAIALRVRNVTTVSPKLSSFYLLRLILRRRRGWALEP